jgi:cytidylate kinase
MAASGKSTVARKIAEKYGLTFVSGGDTLKALALKEGYEPTHFGWWESKEGMLFLANRRRDSKFDEEVDKELLSLAKKGNVVLDSWTMPWLLKRGFKIWLEASPKKRVRRIAERDRMSFKEAFEALKNKESETKAIYKKLYGFSLGEDFEPFDFVLDTDNLDRDQVLQVLSVMLDRVILASASS